MGPDNVISVAYIAGGGEYYGWSGCVRVLTTGKRSKGVWDGVNGNTYHCKQRRPLLAWLYNLYSSV